jgi:hypothetical protein
MVDMDKFLKWVYAIVFRKENEKGNEKTEYSYFRRLGDVRNYMWTYVNEMRSVLLSESI